MRVIGCLFLAVLASGAMLACSASDGSSRGSGGPGTGGSGGSSGLGGSGGSSASCVPGQVSACPCPSGATGQQTCNADGKSFSQCSCGGGTGAGGGGTGQSCTGCSGCCEGTTCVSPTTWTMCGPPGGACKICKSWDTCTNGQCKFDPNSTWNVQVGTATVPPKDPNGNQWCGGNAPYTPALWAVVKEHGSVVDNLPGSTYCDALTVNDFGTWGGVPASVLADPSQWSICLYDRAAQPYALAGCWPAVGISEAELDSSSAAPAGQLSITKGLVVNGTPTGGQLTLLVNQN